MSRAGAKFSRVVAAEIYGPHRTYGYLYGGSGGAFQTISSAEHTIGVWDGFVPYVMGSPQSIPNCFTVRVNALRVLKNKWPSIIDAIEPGGSGDPYAGLNDEERGALEETRRRQTEFTTGRQEVIHNLTRGIGLLEEAEFAVVDKLERRLLGRLLDVRLRLRKRCWSGCLPGELIDVPAHGAPIHTGDDGHAG
jgi:hypothetical protein